MKDLYSILNVTKEADEKEIKKNIRSRSAKLRYAVRNSNSFFYPHEFRKKFENYFKLEGADCDKSR